MTQKKSYSRFFIILQENEKGYALASDKLPTGYAKLEMKNDKCKVSFYVQNLKKEMQPYYMILICNKKEVKKLIKIGNMNIDDNGRMESSFEYPIENVAGSSMTMDKVVGAAIVKFADSKIVDVMSGFASKEIPAWKEYDIIDEDKSVEEQTNVADTPVLNTEDENIQENTDENTDRNTDENVDENNIFDKYEQSIEDAKDVSEIISDTKAVSEDSDEDLQTSEPGIEAEDEYTTQESEANVENTLESPFGEENIVEEDNRKHKKHEYNYEETQTKEHNIESKDRPIGKSGMFFKGLVKEFEETYDICDEIKKCRWFKVSIKCLRDLYNTSDYNRYTALYYPMIMYYKYVRTYGQLLTGLKYDANGNMKYLVYGILGSKSKSDQPFGGSTGFVTWAPLKESANSKGLGYWLLFYDIRDSSIAIPMK